MIELWGEAVRSIEAQVKPDHRDNWIRPIECIAISEGKIRLRAPNRYHKEWFEDHYLPSILQDLETRANARFTVDFEILEEDPRQVSPSPRSVATASVTELRPASSPP